MFFSQGTWTSHFRVSYLFVSRKLLIVLILASSEFFDRFLVRAKYDSLVLNLAILRLVSQRSDFLAQDLTVLGYFAILQLF